MNKNMPYRIIKKHWRNDQTAEIEAYYVVEKLKITFMSLFTKRLYWKPYKEYIFKGFNSYKRPGEFTTREGAQGFINNLRKEVPGDKLIT